MHIYLPLYNQRPDLWLPHEQEEDEESVETVQDIRNVRILIGQPNGPRGHFGQPGDPHHDEEPQVQTEPNQRISVLRSSHGSSSTVMQFMLV